MGPKGDKVRPRGWGGVGGAQRGCAPTLLTPNLSQGDTVVVEGPAGARGSKGEPVSAGGGTVSPLSCPALGSWHLLDPIPLPPPLQGDRGPKGSEGDKGDKGEQGTPGEKVRGWGGHGDTQGWGDPGTSASPCPTFLLAGGEGRAGREGLHGIPWGTRPWRAEGKERAGNPLGGILGILGALSPWPEPGLCVLQGEVGAPGEPGEPVRSCVPMPLPRCQGAGTGPKPRCALPIGPARPGRHRWSPGREGGRGAPGLAWPQGGLGSLLHDGTHMGRAGL